MKDQVIVIRGAIVWLYRTSGVALPSVIIEIEIYQLSGNAPSQIPASLSALPDRLDFYQGTGSGLMVDACAACERLVDDRPAEPRGGHHE